MFEFFCGNSKCNFSRKLDRRHIGKRAKCPRCNTVTVVRDQLADTAVQPQGNAPCKEPTFDESKTFAYKGDFLGMAIDQFLNRHKTDSPDDFSFVSSRQVPNRDYSKFGFDSTWDSEEPRVECFSATGTRMTIVGVELKYGVYTFLDQRLFLINLKALRDPIGSDFDLEVGLVDVLGEWDERQNVADIFDIRTWVRAEGHLSLVSLFDGSETPNVRYINQLLLPVKNQLEEERKPPPDI